MGALIKASCTCGFETDFTGGSGKHNYDAVCYAPALCRNCNTFVVKNYLEPFSRCEVCNADVTFYNDPAIQAPCTKQSGETEAASEEKRPFILPTSPCLCPACGKAGLRFEHVGCWD